MKRVIIADLKSANANGKCVGHYFALASNYKKVFSPYCIFKIAGGPLYKEQFFEDDLILLPHSFIEGDYKWKNFARMLLNARALFSQIKNDDIVIVQQSQPAMILLVILLSYFGNANLFQIQYSEEPMHRFYFKIMMKLAKKKIKGLICPNKIVGSAYGVPYLSIPDYLYIESTRKKKISFYEKKYDFMSIGRIVNDKGITETAKAFRDTRHSFLIAGKPDESFDVNSLLAVAAANDRMHVSLEYLSENDFNNYIDQSRYCILNYRGTYAERSSGVVLDTLFKGIPVIGRRCRALQFIEDYGLGILYDDINTFDFSSILKESVWEKYVVAIDEYKKQFEDYKQKLLKFTGAI